MSAATASSSHLHLHADVGLQRADETVARVSRVQQQRQRGAASFCAGPETSQSQSQSEEAEEEGGGGGREEENTGEEEEKTRLKHRATNVPCGDLVDFKSKRLFKPECLCRS